jgi:hypothetical protein
MEHIRLGRAYKKDGRPVEGVGWCREVKEGN